MCLQARNKILCKMFGIINEKSYFFDRVYFKKSLRKESSVCVLGSNPSTDKIFIFCTACRPALGPTQPPIQWVPEELLSGVKRPGCEAHNSAPSSAKVKNGAAILPLPHISSWFSAELVKNAQ
jgi:hypothetical protein